MATGTGSYTYHSRYVCQFGYAVSLRIAIQMYESLDSKTNEKLVLMFSSRPRIEPSLLWEIRRNLLRRRLRRSSEGVPLSYMSIARVTRPAHTMWSKHLFYGGHFPACVPSTHGYKSTRDSFESLLPFEHFVQASVPS